MPIPAQSEFFASDPVAAPTSLHSAEIWKRSVQMPVDNMYDMLAKPPEEFDYRKLY